MSDDLLKRFEDEVLAPTQAEGWLFSEETIEKHTTIAALRNVMPALLALARTDKKIAERGVTIANVRGHNESRGALDEALRRVLPTEKG